ncbi:MAG: DNA-directed RNA polymerase subunit A', partial [Candidatus Woesearchaeota archaeon]
MSLEEKPTYKKVEAIIFGILSPKLIKKMAATKIVTPELYDREGYPVDGGLMDTRLGVIDPGLRCRTCGSKLKECTGHFGYMELARPVIHIKFVGTVYTLLKGTCRDCGRALLPEAKIKKYEEHLKKIEAEAGIDIARDEAKSIAAELAAQKKCPHCGGKQGKITLEKPYTFFEDEKKLSSIEIRARLEKISDS